MFWEKHVNKQCCAPTPSRLPGPVESDRTQSLGSWPCSLSILTSICLANEIHWARSDSWFSLPTFTCAHVHHAMLLNICQISRKVTATNVLVPCTGFMWFHSKVAPQHRTTWPSGWGWSPGPVDGGDHCHGGNSRSDDIWIIWWSSTQFSRIGLEFFIRSPHSPIGLDLFIFLHYHETVGSKTSGKLMKIVYEILKAPRWNASSSINTFYHQKSRETNPHFLHIPELKFP